MKRKATMTPIKQHTTGTGTQNKKVHGQYLRAENEALRLQLACKTKQLEAEKILRLKLELDWKTKEIKSMRKEYEKLRDENKYYRKNAKPPGIGERRRTGSLKYVVIQIQTPNRK